MKNTLTNMQLFNLIRNMYVALDNKHRICQDGLVSVFIDDNENTQHKIHNPFEFSIDLHSHIRRAECGKILTAYIDYGRHCHGFFMHPYVKVAVNTWEKSR